MIRRDFETTKKYVRIPDPAGVPFEGFEYAKIKSREIVANQLKQFMKKTKEAQQLTVGLILAEWGEGKTDAFERYIKPEAQKNGDFAYLVSTSTIINKLRYFMSLFPYGYTESVTLATSIIIALRDELISRGQDYSKFPDYRPPKEPLAYIEDVLQKHVSTSKNGVVYIFIDEMEEILIHDNELQKKFISGIRELLNGQLKLVHRGGKFGGKLHLILSCTPYAYNRIRDAIHLREVFGAVDSRLSSSTIRLPPISREEALNFLIDLLKYCYKEDFPSVFPIKSSGILNAICMISQRNLRSLVQLLCDLLVAASLNGNLRVIDYDLLIETFKGKPISIYGAITDRIDKHTLSKIEITLENIKYGKDCKRIFRLLCGEIKPFSILEIERRANTKDIHYRINEINQELRKIGIPISIIKLYKLKENKSVNNELEKIEKLLSQYIEEHPFFERVKETLIHYKLSQGGKLVPWLFLPEKKEFKRILDLSEDIINDVYPKISKDFVSVASECYYMLSDEIANQLFPSPLVFQLDFVVDRSKRLELWREALKEFVDRSTELRDGLIKVINISEEFQIIPSPSQFKLVYPLHSGRQVKIPLFLYVAMRNVTLNDLDNTKKWINKEKGGLVLLFYVGDIEEKAQKELNRIPNVLVFHIRPIRAQQLIALSIAEQRGIQINNKLLKSRLLEIFHELDFRGEFEKWLDKLRKHGILVEDLSRPKGISEENLVKAMVYYIQTVEDKLTTNKVFKESLALQSFKLYKKSGGLPSFAPLDIETEETLKNYEEELCAAGFLKKEGEKILIQTTPIEKRIMEYLHDGKILMENMKRRFIIFAKNERLLEKVYYPILETKGLIKIQNKYLIKVDKTDRIRELRSKIQNYNRDIETLRKEIWWSYAHVCMSKTRQSRIILIEELDKYIQNLIQKLDEPFIRYDDELILRLLRLLDILISHFELILKPMINKAVKKGYEILNKTREFKENTELKMITLLQFYNKYSENAYKLSDIQEYKHLEKLYQKFLKITNMTYDKNAIIKGMKELPMTRDGKPYFNFNRDEESASFFNFKIYKMEQEEKLIYNYIEDINTKYDTIIKHVQDIESTKSEIKRYFVIYEIDEKLLMSKEFNKFLKLQKIKPMKTPILKVITLDDILSFSKKLYEYYKNFYSNIKLCKRILNDLIKVEKVYVESIEQIVILLHNLEKFFENSREFLSKIENIKLVIHNVKDNYNKNVKNFKIKLQTLTDISEINELVENNIKNIRRMCSNLRIQFEKINELLSSCKNFLNDYYYNVQKFLIIFDKKGIPISSYSTSYKEIIDQTIQDIEKLKEGRAINYTWESVKSQLSILDDRLYVNVKNIIPKIEFDALRVIIQISKGRKWMEFSELSNQVAESLNLKKDEAKKVIDALIKQGLLKQGVSLVI